LYLEGDLLRRNGGVVSLGITFAPTLSPEGRLVSIIANLRDITRFREAEELKSTFISVVSHELRTPVALIKGYVGTLRRDDAKWDPAVVRDSLAVIEEEADHLASLIDDLLDASRLQAGALALNLAEIPLSPLLERLVERFRTQSNSHTFTTDVPSDLPVVRGDEQRLTQVVVNLLSNAVKYSPPGSDIHLRVQAKPTEVVVCISDRGMWRATPREPGWDCTWPKPSSKPMAGGFGSTHEFGEVPGSASRCRAPDSHPERTPSWPYPARAVRTVSRRCHCESSSCSMPSGIPARRHAC
jgi:signal transduction histidine kinase